MASECQGKRWSVGKLLGGGQRGGGQAWGRGMGGSEPGNTHARHAHATLKHAGTWPITPDPAAPGELTAVPTFNCLFSIAAPPGAA